MLPIALLMLPIIIMGAVETSMSVMNIFSRSPQIYYSHVHKTTQNLSWQTIALSVVGNCINIAGYYIINHDWAQISVAAVVLMLDVVMLCQIYLYDDEMVRRRRALRVPDTSFFGLSENESENEMNDLLKVAQT
jgi:hypothetical protein